MPDRKTPRSLVSNFVSKFVFGGLPLLVLLLGQGFIDCAWGQGGIATVLQAKYPITQTTLDRSQIATPGAVMQIQANGINAEPVGTIVAFENKVVDGKVQQGSRFTQLVKSKNMKILQPGDKIYITKIEAKSEAKEDDLKFSILTCDPQDLTDGSGQKRLVAVVSFKLPKDSLAQANPDDMERMVEAVMSPSDSAAGGGGQGSPAAPAGPAPVAAAPPPPPPPPPPAPAAATAPQTIALGQSPAQVTAILGPPQQIIDLGAKKTYIYKDMKVIFANGKVSDVQ
jgi:hypothetical protein